MKADDLLPNKIHAALFGLLLVPALIIATGALAAGGTLDPAFGSNGIVVADLGSSSDAGVNVVVQPDGKIVMAASGSAPYLVRYNNNGTLDDTFGTNGKVTAAVGGPVALQTDGKLVVGGGMTGGIGLARYTSGGTLDTTFGTNGVATVWENNDSNFRFSFGDLAIQPDGKIVVVGIQEAIGGNHVYCVIARFHANGVLEDDSRAFFDESNFPESERNFCKAVALQSDGKIILSGHAEPNFTGMAIILGRLKSGSTSSFDPAFGTNGHGTVVTPIARFTHGRGALAIQADGKIVLAGTTSNNLNEDLALIRYNSNGTLDTTLGGSGIVITDLGKNEVGNDLAIQSDGKIIVAGRSYSGGTSNVLLVRYNKNGTLDTTFGEGGTVISDLGGSSDSIAGLALQADGKILATGAKDGDAVLARYSVGPVPTTTTTAFFQSKGSQDGWILESAEFSNAGGSLNKSASTFNAGDDRKDRQFRSVISFNTASLPDNAIVTAAQVNVKRQGVMGTNPFLTHGPLLLEIRNGLFSNTLDLTRGDFAAAPSSAIPDSFAPLTYSWYTASLSGSNLPFVNKYGLTQFRLRFSLDDNDDRSADYIKFYSGDAPDANRPQLVVSYVLP